mgnify:CR=1 FL=1
MVHGDFFYLKTHVPGNNNQQSRENSKRKLDLYFTVLVF